MNKYLPIFVLLVFFRLYAQPVDSLYKHDDILLKDSTSYEEFIDSLTLSDSLKLEKENFIPDTLVTIQETPLSNFTGIISKKNFLFENYRYAGDYLRLFPLNFIKDLAFPGRQNESFIYGVGFGGISFMEDGLLWNDRYTNTLNLNYVQSEDVDSIEIVPSPRGFIFSSYNNPVSVNFIMRDFISSEPYTRIKYYEGPDGEAMIDGKFNARIYKRWNLSLQVTNRASDDRYINTDYSMWQINAKIKYFLSNKINITAIYQSVDSEIGLNGGVDVDSIAKITNDINAVLYDKQLAIVNSPGKIQKILNHNFRLKAQLLPWVDAKADVSFFYRYADNEISNDLDTVVQKERYDNKNYGAVLSLRQKVSIFSLLVMSTYEKNNTLEYAGYLSDNDLKINHNYFAVSSVLSVNLMDGKIIPSFFYKYSKQSVDPYKMENPASNTGYGFDILYKPFDFFSAYSGYSSCSQFNFDNVKTFEAGGMFQNPDFLADVKFFFRDNFIPVYIRSLFPLPESEVEINSVNGFGLLVNYKFWKLLIETNTSYYFDLHGYSSTSLPQIQFAGGIYVNDYFFEQNLLVKAGVKFYYTGKLSAYAENFGIIDVDPSNKIDFTLAGEIKKVAVVYFIWENLLGNNYFITPYYPMPERNIRFGLAWELFN